MGRVRGVRRGVLRARRQRATRSGRRRSRPAGPLLRRIPPSVDGVVVLSHYGLGSPSRSSARTWRSTRCARGRSLLSMRPWAFPPKRRCWPRLRGVVGPDRRGARSIVHARGRLSRGLREGVPRVAAAASRWELRRVSRTHDAVEAVVESLQKTDGEHLATGAPGCVQRWPRCDSRPRPARCGSMRNRQAIVPVHARAARRQRAGCAVLPSDPHASQPWTRRWAACLPPMTRRVRQAPAASRAAPPPWAR